MFKYTERYESVDVLEWGFSHYTGNGNAVHKFKIKTPNGVEIIGKTAPNNGFASFLPSSPNKLYNVEIVTTARRSPKMTDANNTPA